MHIAVIKFSNLLSKELYRLVIIHVFFPLIVGCLIYIFFRSISIRFFYWFEIVGIKSFVLSIRNIIYPFKNELPTWIYFSLPDGLWVYSLSSALIILWREQFKFGKYWLMIPLLFGAFFEFGQKMKIFPGTYDIIDFTFSIIALILSIITLKPKIQKK